MRALKFGKFAAVLALTLCASSSALAAQVLADGLYQLQNHRDGALRPPLYGLRLDGLDGNVGNDYTFDFDAPGADMRMDLDVAGGTIRIFGTAFGGLDVGPGFDNPANGRVGLWRIDFTYNVGVTALPSGEIVAGPMSAQNSGFIQPLFAGAGNFAGNPQIALTDYNGNAAGRTFHLNTGHRGNPGVSGWGWLNHGTFQQHIYASDWLFEVNGVPIPAPGAAMLGLLGTAAIGFVRRRIG